MLMKGVVNLLWMMVYMKSVISCPLCVEVLFIEKKKHLKSPWKSEKIEENLSLYLFFQLRPVKSKFTGIDIY